MGGIPAGPKKRAISVLARRQGDIKQPFMSAMIKVNIFVTDFLFFLCD